MSVGFIHGVMNTDNVLICGETIDFGPCAFMESYDPATVFSSIDHGGRYAYQNQPAIMQWNMARFAECLIPQLDKNVDRSVEIATEEIQRFVALYEANWLALMKEKTGLSGDDEKDAKLVEQYLALLHSQHIDFTLAFSALGDVAVGNDQTFLQLFHDPEPALTWLKIWKIRTALNVSKIDRDLSSKLKKVNPLIIARNHQVEKALELAQNEGDFGAFEQLLSALQQPYNQENKNSAYREPASEDFTRNYQTFCGT